MVNSVNLSEYELIMPQNDNHSITISYTPDTAEPDFYWVESNSNIATISGSGDSWNVNSSSPGEAYFYLYDTHDDKSTLLAELHVTVE